MIYLRLDERLMHGQVTTTWISYLNITHIVIAEDKVADDEMHCQLLKMAAPKGVKMLVRKVDEAIQTLNDLRCQNMKLLVICANLDDVLKIIEGVESIKDVNLANYGFQSNLHGTNKIMLTSNLSVDEREKEIVRKIVENKDLNVYCQVLANQAKKIINL